MMRAARVSSRPRAASTWAVIPTLVATIAAPVKMLSMRGSPQSAQMPQPMKNGQDDAGDGDQQRRAADAHQLGCFDLQPDAEEKEHHAEVGEDAEDFVGRHPAEDVGSDEDAGENFADDAGLAEALEDFGEELGGGEHHQHRERDLRGAAGSIMLSLCGSRVGR